LWKARTVFRRGRSDDPSDSRWSCSKVGHAIEGQQVVLRRVAPEDRDTWRAGVDDEVVRWNGWTDSTIPRVFRAQLNGMTFTPHYREAWVIVERATECVVGSQSLMEIGRVEVQTGGWLAPDARGRGLGSDAARSVATFAHEHLGYERVTAGTDVANAAAQQQYLAAGFTELARKNHHLPDGRETPGIWLVHTSPSIRRCPHLRFTRPRPSSSA
jgi:RimJ/RimL family protein N-acetyltransferase